MRYNDNALRAVSRSLSNPEKEGRLLYKVPKESYKERWFRLRGNLLFYHKTDERGVISESEACGLIYLEQCKMQMEPMADRPFVFSIKFQGEGDKKHLFSAQTLQQCHDWITALTEANGEHIKARLKTLQSKVIKLTGRDPMPALRDKSCPVTSKRAPIKAQDHPVESEMYPEIQLNKTSTFYRPSDGGKTFPSFEKNINSNLTASNRISNGKDSKDFRSRDIRHPVRHDGLKPVSSYPSQFGGRLVDPPLIQFEGMDLQNIPNMSCDATEKNRRLQNSQLSAMTELPRPSSFAGFDSLISSETSSVHTRSLQSNQMASQEYVGSSCDSNEAASLFRVKSAFKPPRPMGGWETFD